MFPRRSFLKAASAAAFGALTDITHASLASDVGNASSNTSIIDTHAHWTGPTVIKLLKQRKRPPSYVEDASGNLTLITTETPSGKERSQAASWFDLEARLKHLDESGVTTQVLSWTGATYEGLLTPEEAKPIWKAQNNDLAAAVKAYPGRFIGLTTLPTADPNEAAQELRRAHEELGLLGATLPLDAFIQIESARYLKPIFDEAQRQKSHIFIHRGVTSPNVPGTVTEVGASNRFFGLAPSDGPNEKPKPISGDDVIARSTLITSTHLASGVLTLALSDFLDPYPDVSVQIAMIGGSAAFVAEQIQFAEEAAGQSDSSTKLRRLYYDTGQFGRGPHNIAFAANVFGSDRILFGSDYGPQGSLAPYIAGVRQANLSPDQTRQVFSANAQRLFTKGRAS